MKKIFTAAFLLLFAALFTACDIDDYDMSKLGRFDGLSIETEKKIISGCQKEIPDLKLRDIWTSAYYGTYNGVVFVEILIKDYGYAQAGISAYSDICIDGITIIEWRKTSFLSSLGQIGATKIWHNGRFYQIHEVYNLGLITLDDIKTIAGYFGGWIECPHNWH